MKGASNVPVAGMAPPNEIGSAGVMVKVTAAVVAVIAVGVPESVTWKARLLKVPAQDAVSVPDIVAPDAEFVIVRHVGSVPLLSAHVYGGIPPVPVSVTE